MVTMHVMPHGDLVGHTPQDDCVCGPTQKPALGIEGGGWAWVAVHHALDGRAEE